ncbi:MAG: YdcF family protein [Nitrospirae bacterium]|nr:YdcF family protein [Nitrospirota bacterium]
MTNLIIKKCITAFILPPGIFISILMLISIIFFVRKRFKPAFISMFLFITLWIFSIFPTADILLKGLESGYSIPINPKGDLIVLLGGGVIEDAPDITGIGVPCSEFYARIIAAVRLQKMLNVPVLISGGKVFNSNPEALIVKRFLIDLGVPAPKIYIEDESRDTLENALNTKTIIIKYGFKNPLVVTTALHMRRAELCFQKAGLKIKPYPVGFKTLQGRPYRWYNFLPHADNMENISAAMHEYIGYQFYKMVY